MFGVRGRDVDSIAEANGFSGVVRVDRGDDVEFASAYGLAHRGHGIPNTLETQFGTASATKGLTALAVVSLIEEGVLELSTTARSVLGGDLPLIGDDVTIEHLLSHRSGIGDYLDEETYHVTDYVMPVPVHELADDGGLPRDPRRARHQVPAGRAVRLQQRRVRRARADRRASERCSVPSARARSRHASRPGWPTPRSCAPTSSRGLRRSGTSRWTASCGRTCSTCPCGAAATAGSTRPWRTSARSGARSSPAGSSRPTGLRRWCGRAATCRESRGATASASGSTSRATSCSWSGPTRASRSGARTTRSER